MMETESDYVILDVRTPEEFKERHIPDAINVPNETIGSGEIPQLPDKNQLILIYCRSGNRSKRAAEKLARLGLIFEINTGAVARGYRSVPYPTLPLLKEIKRQGFGILFTSDCHEKNFFDCAFDDAVDLALAAGYKEYFVLRDGAFVPESLLE